MQETLQQLKKLVGIYKIISPTKKVYIGQSVDINKRFKTYKHLNSSKEQVRLYNSFKKYGINKHYFSIVTECEPEQLNALERYYQDLYSCCGKHGLNCKLTKGYDRSGSISEESRKKMSASRKGVPHSEATRAKRKLLSYPQLTRFGVDNGFFGRSHSEETKLKISKIHSGNKYCVGRVLSLETKQKIGVHQQKKVLNTVTNEVYSSAKGLAKIINMNYSNLRNQLNGSRINHTIYKYL